MKKKHYLVLLFLLALIPGKELMGQEKFTLKQCLDYALENNQSLQKDRLGRETAIQARRELIGSLLPQINGSGAFNYNIQKTTIAMPNFVNQMIPEPMRDPNASKYMTVTMGMDLSATGVWPCRSRSSISRFSMP